MNTSNTGSAGEQAAAEYLIRNGFEIIERNFKTPRCEIDIIAHKDRRLYFVEVKFRRSDQQGGGLDYVTGQKRLRMQRASEIWLQGHDWRGEVTLSAIEVGTDYEVTDFIESIDG